MCIISLSLRSWKISLQPPPGAVKWADAKNPPCETCSCSCCSQARHTLGMDSWGCQQASLHLPDSKMTRHRESLGTPCHPPPERNRWIFQSSASNPVRLGGSFQSTGSSISHRFVALSKESKATWRLPRTQNDMFLWCLHVVKVNFSSNGETTAESHGRLSKMYHSSLQKLSIGLETAGSLPELDVFQDLARPRRMTQ